MSSTAPMLLAELEQVLDGVVEVLLVENVRLSSGVCSALSYSLMLNFRRPTREKSYLRASKNMPWNSCVAVSSVGGSPGRSLR